MSPEDALKVLDLLSRLAPVTYDDQVKRCAAVDVLKAAIAPPEEKQEAAPAVESKPVRKGAKS